MSSNTLAIALVISVCLNFTLLRCLAHNGRVINWLTKHSFLLPGVEYKRPKKADRIVRKINKLLHIQNLA